MCLSLLWWPLSPWSDDVPTLGPSTGAGGWRAARASRDYVGQPSRIHHGETREKGRIGSCDMAHLMQRKLTGFVRWSSKTLVVPQHFCRIRCSVVFTLAYSIRNCWWSEEYEEDEKPLPEDLGEMAPPIPKEDDWCGPSWRSAPLWWNAWISCSCCNLILQLSFGVEDS